jgi:hypothetical protein
MESKAIDPVDFREAQHKHWASAAVGWKEWSEFNDSADRHISERLVELAEVGPASRVLDIAAGYGEPALTSTFRTRASTPPSRAGESFSSLTRRPPQGASEASSSRARGWRSARGASPIRSSPSRFR